MAAVSDVPDESLAAAAEASTSQPANQKLQGTSARMSLRPRSTQLGGEVPSEIVAADDEDGDASTSTMTTTTRTTAPSPPPPPPFSDPELDRLSAAVSRAQEALQVAFAARDTSLRRSAAARRAAAAARSEAEALRAAALRDAARAASARAEEARARGEEQAHGERARRLNVELAPLEEALAAAGRALEMKARRLDDLRARLSRLPPPPPPSTGNVSAAAAGSPGPAAALATRNKKKGDSNNSDGAASDVSSTWGTDTDDDS